MSISDAQKKYEKKRAMSCKVYAVKYTSSEQSEIDRINLYLEKTKQSANSYIKSLIKADLDEKEFMIDTTDTDTDTTDTAQPQEPDT